MLMKKIQLLLMLGIVSLLASCGEKALTFSNYEKNADAQWPDGVPASLELTLAIPQGESEVQEKVTAAIKEIVSRSRIAEELGTPEGETLEAIADNYHKRFMKGITEGELEAPCVYHLQITSPYSNSQCAVLQVSDGVYGNGGPTEYVWNVRLSDGRLMPFNEISTMNRSKLLNLAQQFANEDDKEDIKLNLEDFWLYPTAEGCKVKAQTGTHFFKDFVVPMEEVEPYLTSEGKNLFGVETKAGSGTMIGRSGGNSPESITKKAIECLKNNDEEGLKQLFIEEHAFRARHALHNLNRHYSSIEDYHIKDVDEVDDNGKTLWWVSYDFTDTKGKKGTGSFSVIKDENGTYMIEDYGG